MKKNNQTAQEIDHAIQNAKGWSDTIANQVAALEMDWERYEELKDMALEDMDEDEKEELQEMIEIVTADGDEYENEEQVRERITEEPLSVEVRSDWYAPGSEQDKPSEFMILLSTGGPALRIRGELNQYGQPDRCWMEYQDWGTPWTEYLDNDRSTLLTWCRVFYFGD